MLALLSSVKARLGLADIDPTYDALLTDAITAVGARFDRECGRTLARTAGFTQEFNAAETGIIAACYPIEQIAGFDLKTRESEGWVAQPAVECLVRRGVVIILERPLGTCRQWGRVTYTGGYVMPGTVPEAGQTMLPVEIEHAAIEQVAFWFQNRDRIGCSRVWDYHGTFRHFENADLPPGVRAVLQNHRRFRL